MFRNHYDHDVSIWSPQGRIHQIEYAMEAVKQGSAAISLKSNDYAVIVALKRSPSELSSYQEKILYVDDHIGVAMAGLTTDGRLLCRAMRRECANNKWSFDEPLPVTRLMYSMSLKMHPPTQRYGHRPFGAGLLVCGYDKEGPHVYYLCPSANSYDFKCTAIGARSQSARTYLERHYEEFKSCSLNELVVHGLMALQGTLPSEVEINNKAYITSSQLYNWKFPDSDLSQKRQLANSNAAKRINDHNQTLTEENRLPILTPEDELILVKRYIFIMQTLFNKFVDPCLPVEVFGFAVHYFKRFYLNHSVMDFFPRELMLTCLYLSCKCADFPIGLHHFVSHIPRNQERYCEFIVNSELFLIDALNYDLFIHTPHRAFMGLIVDLIAYNRQIKPENSEGYLSKDDVCKLINELQSEGYELIHKWLQTDICLTLQPSEYALAILVHLGKDRPFLDVEAFVRDELCGCDPIKPGEPENKESQEDYDEYDEDNDSNGVAETQKVKPIERWSKLRRVLDSIKELISEFDFIIGLTSASPEEVALEKCRNPLYNPECEEYQAAKVKAESLLLQDL